MVLEPNAATSTQFSYKYFFIIIDNKLTFSRMLVFDERKIVLFWSVDFIYSLVLNTNSDDPCDTSSDVCYIPLLQGNINRFFVYLFDFRSKGSLLQIPFVNYLFYYPLTE